LSSRKKKSKIREQPVSIASRAKARVDGHRVVQRRPLYGGIPFAQFAYIKPFPSANPTRQRHLSLHKNPTKKITLSSRRTIKREKKRRKKLS
jgi:hypothetical protein